MAYEVSETNLGINFVNFFFFFFWFLKLVSRVHA